MFDAKTNMSIPTDSKTTSTQEKVVIIIPTHNEAAIIQNTIQQLFTAIAPVSAYDIHVLVFDSASTDETQKLVSMLQADYPKLHLRTESTKSGLGSAYLQAMNYALHALEADIIFEFDADLSHQPKYIPPMLEMLQHYDCVVGSRYVPKGSIPKDWALHRKLFSTLGNYVARAILTPKYKDFTSGFRATRRQQLLKALPEKFLTNQYAYKLQLLWTLHKNKARITEYPIEFIDRSQGDSKLPKNSISDSLRVIFILRYRELQRYLKMCLIGSLGMIVQFAIFNLLRNYLSPFHASQVAVLGAIVNNFILNSSITFKIKQQTSRALKIQRLLTFAVYSIMMIYLQSYWLRLGILCFGHGVLMENLIMALGIALMSVLNYFTYSRHIWAEKLALNN